MHFSQAAYSIFMLILWKTFSTEFEFQCVIVNVNKGNYLELNKFFLLLNIKKWT